MKEQDHFDIPGDYGGCGCRSHRARAKKTVEPSGTGQAPSAPPCECGHSPDDHINGFGQIRDCGAETEGGYCGCARYREQAAPVPTPIAEPTA